MIKETYQTRDMWVAAWLDSQGVPIVSAYRYGQWDRVELSFDNEGDRAWKLATQFRTGDALVAIRQFRDSYRFVLDMADRARKQTNPNEDTKENEQADGYAAK